MEKIEDAKKAIGLIFVIVIMLCLFTKTAYFNSLMKGDSDFEYQKIAGGGLIGMLLVVFVIKYI
jgi:hypothetical protein